MTSYKVMSSNQAGEFIYNHPNASNHALAYNATMRVIAAGSQDNVTIGVMTIGQKETG
jgi:hypothetical protein